VNVVIVIREVAVHRPFGASLAVRHDGSSAVRIAGPVTIAGSVSEG
jgi:hypothetical protein